MFRKSLLQSGMMPGAINSLVRLLWRMHIIKIIGLKIFDIILITKVFSSLKNYIYPYLIAESRIETKFSPKSDIAMTYLRFDNSCCIKLLSLIDIKLGYWQDSSSSQLHPFHVVILIKPY